jgi:peptidoglycan/xylan/chitin deacetylase (PgdA/CDA1 family)
MFSRILILIILLTHFSSFSQNNNIHVIFRIDDFGRDNEEFYPPLFDLFEKYNAKIVLAVVPFHHKTGLTDRQKEILRDGLNRNVIEIAQHGFTHAINIKNGNIYNEFLNQPFNEQFDKIKKGKEYLENEFNIIVQTFIPPQNQYDENTIRALDSLNFKTISAELYSYGVWDIPKIKSSSLNFIPYTTTLNNFDRAFKNALKSDLDHAKIIVAMTHDFEFLENKKYYDNYQFPQEYPDWVGNLTLEKLESNLSVIYYKENCFINSFNDLVVKQSLINSESLNANIEDYLIRIPSSLRLNSSGFYPADESRLVKYIFYPLIIFALSLLLGVGSGLILNKLYGKKLSTKIILTYSSSFLVLLTSGLLLLLNISSHTLGPVKLIIITFLYGFLIVFLWNGCINKYRNYYL